MVGLWPNFDRQGAKVAGLGAQTGLPYDATDDFNTIAPCKYADCWLFWTHIDLFNVSANARQITLNCVNCKVRN